MKPERLLTEAFAPWLVLTTGAAVLGAQIHSPKWGLATGLGLGVLPQAAIGWRVRRKALSDHHVTRREDRPLVIAGIAGSVSTLLLAQHHYEAPPELRRMARAGLVSLAVAGAATFGIKVSFHTAVLAGVTAVFAREVTPRAWWGLGLLPPVAWARVRISHHTPLETAVGGVIGVAGGYWGGGKR